MLASKRPDDQQHSKLTTMDESLEYYTFKEGLHEFTDLHAWLSEVDRVFGSDWRSRTLLCRGAAKEVVSHRAVWGSRNKA